MANEISRISGARGFFTGRLQVKLAALVGMILALVLVMTFAYFRTKLSDESQHNLESKADATGTLAAFSMAEGVEFGDAAVLGPMVDGMVNDPDLESIAVYDKDGKFLAGKPKGEAVRLDDLLKTKNERTASTIGEVRELVRGGKRVGAVKIVYSMAGAQGRAAAAARVYAGICFIAFLVAMGLLTLVLGQVVRPIIALTEATVRVVRSGDLSQKIDVHSNDEVGVLADAFAEMLAKLRDIPIKLRGSTETLQSAVDSLTGVSKQQTSSVQRQASGLAEASATTQEIKQTSALAATKAETVLQIAAKAEEFSGAGQNAVEASIGGLKDIRSQIDLIVERIADLSERTLQVGEIIDSVKDLADQSNVLALNAAIEAAKAGEFGKGFAVVAREIRSLADQSIQSTGRIREILSEIQVAIRSTAAITEEGKRRMEQSMDQIRSSGESLREMTAIVHESSQAARQIAASVSQQNAGISQISGAIGALNGAMEETVTGIKGAESAVDNLKAISQRIAGIVDAFQV